MTQRLDVESRCILKELTMKILLISLTIIVSASVCFSQTSSRWYRVHTLDDSYIDMDTEDVDFEGATLARVSFQWTFAGDQSLNQQLTYRRRIDLVSVDCEKNLFWTWNVKYIDSAGTMIFEQQGRPAEWRKAGNPITANMISAGCELVKARTARPTIEDEIKRQKAAKTAYEFVLLLQDTQDVGKLMPRFFSSDYVSGYLMDQSANWFMLVEPTVAATAKRDDLQRFYEALINNEYLGTRFLYAQRTSDPDESKEAIPEQKANPPQLVQFVNNHPYSKYKHGNQPYDYLAERIDSVERLQVYTNLLEGINRILRKEIANQPVAKQILLIRPSGDQEIDWGLAATRTCSTSCLGLPVGTKLYRVEMPCFHLQLAEIKGEMKIVSSEYDCK